MLAQDDKLIDILNNSKESLKQRYAEKVLQNQIRQILNGIIGEQDSLSNLLIKYIEKNMNTIVRDIYKYSNRQDYLNALNSMLQQALNNLELTERDVLKLQQICEMTWDSFNPQRETLLNAAVTVEITDLNIEHFEKNINRTGKNSLSQSSNKYTQLGAKVTEKIDKNSEEPNFITIFKDSELSKKMILSVPEWLFTFLAEHEDTANMVDVMKWLLGIVTEDKNLQGITVPWLSLISNNQFIDFEFSGLEGYLKQFSHSGEAPMYNNGEKVEGKQFYRVYDDSVHLATIGTGDICLKYHHAKFASAGYVLEIRDGQNPRVWKEENIEKYLKDRLGNDTWTVENNNVGDAGNPKDPNGIYIEKSFVDNVAQTIRDDAWKLTENLITSNLGGNPFSTQQMYALVSITYGRTFKFVEKILNTYKEGLAIYSQGSWEHNKYFWDNYFYSIDKNGSTAYCKGNDARMETYIKGTYDFSASGGVFGRTTLKYYTSEQIAEAFPTCTIPLSRTTANEEEIFTYEESENIVNKVITLARSKLGCGYSNDDRIGPYHFDCSGLIYWCYKVNCGINVPGTTLGYYESQWDNKKIYENTAGLTESECNTYLKPGDVLVWNNLDGEHRTCCIIYWKWQYYTCNYKRC